MSYFRLSLLASVCAAALTGGAAHQAWAEPLDQAVASALSQHPSISAAEATRSALAEDAREKQSDYYPQISAEATGGRIYGDNATSRGLSVTRGAGYSGYGEGSVSLTQNFFNGFQTGDRVHAAAARRDSAGYKIADTREDLALRATLAYLDVLRGQESVDRLQKYGRTLDGYIGRIGKMVKEGGADAALAAQARDIRGQLDNTLASSQGQLRTAIATYTELIGHEPAHHMLKPSPPLDVIPDNTTDAVAWARDHHPTLKAAALNEQAAEMDGRAEEAAFYPTVNGQLSYLKSDERDLLGGELVDARAVVKMNWNYAVGGAEQARVRKALFQREQSRAEHDNLERQVTRRIEIAYSDDRTASEQVKIQRRRVGINEGLFTTQKQQFEGAKVNLLQLEQSDNNLFNARLALMNDEYKALASKYTILASIGRLQDALSVSQDGAPVPAAVSEPIPRAPAGGRPPRQALIAPAPPPQAESLLSTPGLVHAPQTVLTPNDRETPPTPAPAPQPGETVKPALAPVPNAEPAHAD